MHYFYSDENVKSAVVGGIRFVIQPTQIKAVGHLADKILFATYRLFVCLFACCRLLFCWLEAVACLGNYLNSPRPLSPAKSFNHERSERGNTSRHPRAFLQIFSPNTSRLREEFSNQVKKTQRPSEPGRENSFPSKLWSQSA